MAQAFDEHQFRILVEQSLDALVLIQPDGSVSYASPPIARLLGYTPAEFATLYVIPQVHPDEQAVAASRFAELVKQPGYSETVVRRMQHKNGAWKWVETVFTNHLQTAGLGVVVATLRDVTERRQATDAIRAVEEKFRFIVESATGFAIFTTDLHGRVNSWNSGARRIMGYDESEIIGQDCRIFFTPEDNSKDTPEAEMHDALVEGRGEDQRWHVRKDGSQFWGSGLMMPLRDDAGNTAGYLKIFRDMTREKHAEEALKESDRKKDEFLAILAHELRNPLAAISNAASLLRMPGNQRDRDWSQEVIERQSRHLARLLDDLLDMSRITQGKIRLHMERLDLSTVISKAVDVVRPLIEQKTQTLTLVAVLAHTFAIGDAIRLEQVLVNLLTNASKYTDQGGHISVAAHGGEEIVVKVQDSGIGIAPEMQSRIFELFMQVDQSIERSGSGLGIGLTLSRALVEMHGGKIWVESDGPGKGSVFTFTLPAAGDADSESPNEQQQAESSSKKGL